MGGFAIEKSNLGLRIKQDVLLDVTSIALIKLLRKLVINMHATIIGCAKLFQNCSRVGWYTCTKRCTAVALNIHTRRYTHYPYPPQLLSENCYPRAA